MLNSACLPRRRAAMATALVLAAIAPGRAVAAPGIVDGRSHRLAGTHSFSFSPSGAGGTVQWAVDRETVTDVGVLTRTNGILSGSGSNVSFSLPAVTACETIYYIRASDAGASDVDTVQVFPSNTKTWFTYRSAGNPDVRVYCVIPSSLSSSTRVVMAMHGNSRTASNYCDDWKAWGTQHNTIILCPYYDLVNWPTTGHYQMGNVFSADDCEGVKNPEARWTFTIDEGIHARVRDGFLLANQRFDLWGFSGGGQHVHRFMIFKPNAKVRVAITAGSGWYTAPDLGIDCPYGLHDAKLSFTQQDLLKWTGKDMIIMVGSADTVRDADLRITPKAEAQGLNRYQRAGYMYAKGIAANPATHWKLIVVPGVDHDASGMAQAAQAFLQGTTLDAPGPSAPGAQVSWQIQVSPNPVRAGSTLRGEGWSGSQVEVGLYDLAGRRVASRAVSVSDGRWQLSWAAWVRPGTIAKGVYLVRARDGERRAQQKLLVLE